MQAKTLQEVLTLIKDKGYQLSFNLDIPLEFKSNLEVIASVIENSRLNFDQLPDSAKNNREIIKLIAEKSGDVLSELPESFLDDKEIVLKALANDGWRYLDRISDRLKNDIDVVIAAVSSDNRALNNFSDKFKDDERVIQACLKGNGSAYSYFSKRFKNDREIALKLSDKWDFKLSDAPETFRNDREIVKNAIKTDAGNYKYLGQTLNTDIDFIKELYQLNDSILYHMNDQMKAQLFTSKIESEEHYGKKIVFEMILDDGYVVNEMREVKKGKVIKDKEEIIVMNNFPVITYEEDGPVGSYLSVRYINNFMLCGDFIFFIKMNSGDETYTNSLARGGQFEKYGPTPKNNDDFLKHEVYLIPEGVKNMSYSNLSHFPRIYYGREPNYPNSIKLFSSEESYKEALTVLKQEKSYGEPRFIKTTENTLQSISIPVDEIFGAARIYVDGFGWRFLIPNPEGALKALEVLKSTSGEDDLKWIKSQNGKLSAHQESLISFHFRN